MRDLRILLSALIVALCVVVGISARAYFPETATASTQNIAGLESSVRSLEQRLNFIETRIGRLEQQSVLNSTTQTSSTRNELEFNLLQRQIGTLQGQIKEIECGLARLDERTLSPRARAERSNDPCRLNPDAPLRFSTPR